jgi:Mn-dependent DtxR family transcriptional regulator
LDGNSSGRDKYLIRLKAIGDSGGGRLEDKERMVLEAMEKAGKPVRPGDVAKMLGLESREVSKIIRSLRKKGKVTSPKRCFYAPA